MKVRYRKSDLMQRALALVSASGFARPGARIGYAAHSGHTPVDGSSFGLVTCTEDTDRPDTDLGG
jgi:hypothetical protein